MPKNVFKTDNQREYVLFWNANAILLQILGILVVYFILTLDIKLE